MIKFATKEIDWLREIMVDVVHEGSGWVLAEYELDLRTRRGLQEVTQMNLHQVRSALTASEYSHIYNDTRSTITALSGLTTTDLDYAGIELEVDYEIFLADYRGPPLVDAYVGFKEMLRQWSGPWSDIEGSALNDLTAAQYFLAWAWEQNRVAKYCLGGEAVASGWETEDAIECGVVAAVSAAKSLFHAKSLMASGGNKMAPKSFF